MSEQDSRTSDPVSTCDSSARIEVATSRLRWYRAAPNPVTGESDPPRLQQCWQVSFEARGGAQKHYEEWRDIPEVNFYD